MLKNLVMLNIFVETVIQYIIFKGYFDESLKKQHLFEIDIFCNVINVSTVTFDHFNASLINKSINFIQINSYSLQTFQQWSIVDLEV